MKIKDKQRALQVYNYIMEGLTLTKSLSTLKIFLELILPLICSNFNIEIFKVYLLGLILQDRWFSAHGISKRAKTISIWQIYYALNDNIKWDNVFYSFAKAVMAMFSCQNWYLVTDGSPLRQEHAENRITKRGFINIKDEKNVPHNELISLSLTNGIIYIPLDFRIWTSKKVTLEKEYKKKTELFFAMIYRCLIRRFSIKTILFDNGFASKDMLNWLNKNGYIWVTRMKSNKNVNYNGKKCKLSDVLLKNDKGLVLKMTGVSGLVKIVRTLYQDEVVYIATNQTDIEDAELISKYKKRWGVEVFHRGAKQDLGLENIHMRSWQKLQNHVGFVCLAYALLSILRQEWKCSFSEVKYVIHDNVYGISDAHERLLQKMSC
jgi:hypothetical protein